MSFWDNMKKFAQPYADDDYDDYDDEEYDEEYDEPAEPAPRRERRRPAPAPASMPALDEEEEEEDFYPTPAAPAAPVVGFSGTVLNRGASASNKQEVVLFRPATFNDTSKAADDLRNHKAVIVNMENIDTAMARRIVDFMSGCVYALNGDVKKIARSAYLFCPPNMGIVGDLDALQAEAESYV